MKATREYNKRVPKTVRENMLWRANLHRMVMNRPELQDVIRETCKQDPLFFINAFCYTYDPRREPFSRVPFILYPFQEDAIIELARALGVEDVVCEKSRDMGASWICIAVIVWAWLFQKDLSFLLGSRVEAYVDDPGNPKSMFWKIDYILNNLPEWLLPKGYDRKVHRRKLHIENPELGGVIDGESTNENFSRGDRRTAIVLDEFSAVEQGWRILNATRDATNCRIFNSTPQGINNAFFDVTQRKDILKIRMHWSVHPEKALGMYTTASNGTLKVLNQEGWPVGYKPILDGKLRSPWYDIQCARAANAQEIAQELDIDYLGSGFQFFSADTIRERIREHARPPQIIGDLEYDDDTGEPIRFREHPDGSLKLWVLLDGNGEPPREHKITVGADVSAGTGASNSALAGWDNVTNGKVFEYVNAFVRPEQFAKQSVAICRWFGNPLLIWESGGPGRQFGSRVQELSYGNVYLRRREEALSKKVSEIPGVAQTKETKAAIMGEYRAAIEKASILNRSKEALEECLEYIFAPDGSVVHSRATKKDDPSGAKANHGDRAMADALAWKGMQEYAVRTISQEACKPSVPYGSLAWRNKMREERDNPRDRLPRGWRS